MLEISARKVAQVALMARELERAEGELRAFVDRLSEDEQAELVAIMWIGRESFFAEDLAEAISTARAEATTPCSDYLIGTPHLSDHLENGLDALGISATDAEDDVMGSK
jgi:light-regulated signal transduction histidine kinase (bacteriophytochrome)